MCRVNIGNIMLSYKLIWMEISYQNYKKPYRQLCCPKHWIKKITVCNGSGIFRPYITFFGEAKGVGVCTSYHSLCSKILENLNVMEWIELFTDITE